MAAEAEAGALFTLRLAGIEVAVRPSFVVTALLFGAVGGRRDPADIAIWVAVVFVSVLWHELGHALAGRAFGTHPRIELNGGGGLTFDANVDLWWKELLVCLAGPFAGFLLGGLAWALAQHPSTNGREAALLESAIYVNIGWGALNLLPVFPYDGGQAFRAFAVKWIPEGRRVAIVVSFVVATLGLTYALLQRRFWLAYLAGRGVALAYQDFGQLRAQRKLDESWRAWSEGDVARCERLARETLELGGEAALRALAVERVAWTMLARGDWKGARAWLGELPPGFACSPFLDATLLLLDKRAVEARARLEGIDPAMLQIWKVLVTTWVKASDLDVAELVDRLLPAELAPQVSHAITHDIASILFYAGKLEESASVSARAFEAHGSPVDAYNVACSASRLGHLDHALVWLERAFNAGWSDKKTLDEDPDLAAVREAPEYAAVAAKLAATPIA